jgi:hypothetical protein
MEFHIESIAQDFAARGLSEVEARAAARRKFGNMTQKSEESRSVWLLRWWSDLAQDLRYSFRGMRRDAGFAAFTILIAGLGIGACSTVFSVVNALLLRPLPFHDPGRLVFITNGNQWTSAQTEHYSDLRELNRSFSELAGFADWGVGDRELTGEPERLTSVPVTGNFFAVLGVQPAIGRSFNTEECQGTYRAPSAMLLSYNFWRWRFASDPSVVGRKLTLNNRPVTVVGVLPASFDLGSVFMPGTPIDIVVPWPLNDKAKPAGNTMRLIGRLAPGATVAGAQAEFSILGKQLESQHPERNGIAPLLVPLAQRVSGPVSPALFVLGCAVSVVMLIVCANLSNLQLARLGTRQKEMAMRAALRIDPSFRLASLAQQNAFIDDVLNRARSVPGIVAAGITDVLPLRDDRSWSVSVKGQVYEKNRHPEPFIRVVTDGYFEAAGIPLRAGRLLTERDRATSQPVTVVNETMARTTWPSENPLGQTITTYGGQQVLGVVIGVVGDVRHEAMETAGGSEMYLPMRQTGDYEAMQLVVRTALPPDGLAAGIRTALRPIDPNLPVREFVTSRIWSTGRFRRGGSSCCC